MASYFCTWRNIVAHGSSRRKFSLYTPDPTQNFGCRWRNIVAHGVIFLQVAAPDKNVPLLALCIPGCAGWTARSCAPRGEGALIPPGYWENATAVTLRQFKTIGLFPSPDLVRVSAAAA